MNYRYCAKCGLLIHPNWFGNWVHSGTGLMLDEKDGHRASLFADNPGATTKTITPLSARLNTEEI